MSSILDEGYQVKLVDGLPTRLTCPLCHKLMKCPLQTYRGEMACTSCYTRHKGDTNICPIDHEEIAANQIYPDRAIEQEILKLKCYCENESYGCPWTGTVKLLQDHQSSECQFYPLVCHTCHKKFSQTKLENHQVECFKNLLPTECPYGLYGCNFQPATSEEIDEHLLKNIRMHTELFTRTRNKEMELLKERCSKLESDLAKERANTEIVKEFNKKLLSMNSKGTQLFENTVYRGEELRRIATTITTINQNLSDVDLRHQLHENTTYTGHMVWKIDNYNHRYKQAVTGKTTALHSAPAFTDKYGYKFCARLYLNGDGMGKGTHLSLFFVLMKSEFDNLLQWPFTKTVTFTLINQDYPDLNVKESFNADVNSQSFKKPTKQMNIASGCPFFITQEKLKRPGYIKNQCFFIRVDIR